MSIVTYENVDTPVFEIDFLRYLFANGAQGSLWGPLPYYSDAAGTVEADWGDPVGFIPDASGNEQDWTQPTSTARPILGRVPVGGRRNLLTSTASNNGTVGVVGEGGALPTGWSVVDSLGLSIEVLATNVDPDIGGCRVRIFGAASAGLFRLRVSTVTSIPTGTAISGCIHGWIVSRSGTTPVYGIARVNALAGASTTLSAMSAPLSSATISWLGGLTTSSEIRYELRATVPSGGAEDVDLVVEIGGSQIELGNVATDYQRVGNEYDITEAGVEEVHYLHFDGTDDQVTTTLPAISGGTIVLAGTNGIWIDEIDFAGGAFSVGPNTYTGGPTGLMSILGDILVEGGFVIDRALTPEEIAQVKKYYKARGAAGLFVLEPGLIVNGTFDTDTDWEKAAPWSISGGVAVCDAGTATDYLRQSVAGHESLAQYMVVFDVITRTAGNVRYRLGASASGTGVGIEHNNTGTKRQIGQWTGSNSTLLIQGFSGSIDNVSLRKLELTP